MLTDGLTDGRTDGRTDRRTSSIHKPELLCNPANKLHLTLKLEMSRVKDKDKGHNG